MFKILVYFYYLNGFVMIMCDITMYESFQ